MGAVGNTFESNHVLEEKGMCREAVEVVRIEFRVAEEVTAVLVLKLDDNVVGGVGIMRVVVIMLVPILVLLLVEMDAVVGRSHG